MMTELKPIYENRKSYYSKANVLIKDGVITLYSYNTKVVEIRNNKAKILGFHSNTTLRHIKEFLLQNGFEAGTKKELESMYM